MKNRDYPAMALQKLFDETREILRKIHAHATVLKYKRRDKELAQAALLVHEQGVLLTKDRSKATNASHIVPLHATLNAVLLVLQTPTNIQRVQALERAATEHAPGKPSGWEIFFGVVTLFVGLAMIAASIIGMPFTGGLSGFGMFAGGAVAGGGVALITHGCRKHRLAQTCDELTEVVQNRLDAR